MAYLVAAYAVLWAISFGLVFSIVLRQRRIQADLEALRLMIQDESHFEEGGGLPVPNRQGRYGSAASE